LDFGNFYQLLSSVLTTKQDKASLRNAFI